MLSVTGVSNGPIETALSSFREAIGPHPARECGSLCEGRTAACLVGAGERTAGHFGRSLTDTAQLTFTSVHPIGAGRYSMAPG